MVDVETTDLAGEEEEREEEDEEKEISDVGIV